MKRNSKFLPLFLCIALVGCGYNSSDDSQSAQSSSDDASSSIHTESSSNSENPLSNFEKAALALKNYDIESTNGYDYSLKQYLGKDVTNSDEIELRADFSGSVIARKTQRSTRLNEYGSGAQFTTTESTTYFNNNTIGELKNGKWSWSNCKKSAYFATGISDITIEKEWLSSIKETLDENYVLSAEVLDDKAGLLLGMTTSINSLSMKLTVNNDFSSFVSIEMSYFQSATRSEMSFSSYSGSVDITLPK